MRRFRELARLSVAILEGMMSRFLFRTFKARYRDQSAEIQAATSCLRPGDIALDVGAYKGVYLYWLRKSVGSAGKVHAYEPQRTPAQYLNSVNSRFGWRNVLIHDCAISDFTGSSLLYVPGPGPSPGASLEKVVSDPNSGHSYVCSVDTLD